MIRFSCPQCHREYVLADALAHLPLLCKGCGQRLNVPDPQPEPELLPPPPVKPAPRPVPKPPVVAAPTPKPLEPEPAPEPPARPHNGDPEYYSSTVNFDVVERPPPREVKPAVVAEEPAVRPASRRGIGRIVDAAVFLILLAVGAVAAEMLLGKSSLQVLRESSSAPKFPPTDLLIWLAGPVLFGLLYVWLGTRGWTVGGWLKRRAER